MSTEALQWFKSTYSSDEGGACVEVAVCPRTIHIRDSKQPSSPDRTLEVSPATWAAFASSLK
ncbi:DNA-binding protein [Streptomyces incarnatus]|uniref:DNA-binding protein n=1 Tax=Streptomyces incarnatus TaxID=665007 RepID=A0ABN4GG44_9ACTN|nr:DUF397 domain-containing protein [Streptomyces incarnatus]AKJ11802.1 DNA-binding protein [Streptomyces incarnatus]